MTGPSVPFAPGDVALGTYTFLPYVRAGLSTVAAAPSRSDPLHATAQVSVPITVDGQGAGSVPRRLVLRGPGDVMRVDERQVVRRCPPDGATGVEPNYLVHVEFDRPELPWLFTPAAPGANDRLLPWLVLVVLSEGRYTPQPLRAGLVPSVLVRRSELQSLDDSWAWAHSQVLGGTTGAPIADRLSEEYASINLSRLLCPRQLQPNTSYLACVVPAVDAGRHAALGDSEPDPSDPAHPDPAHPDPAHSEAAWTLGSAWTRAPGDDDVEIELPVFHSWRFSTGDAGDFESLATRLEPVPAGWQVGRRLVDTSDPWPGSAVDSGRLRGVPGPLVSPHLPSASSADPAELAAAGGMWPSSVTEQLRARLDAAADLADNHAAPAADAIPTVAPPIYAGAQTARRRVAPAQDASWFGQLNLQPGNRIVAGLGARVIQHDQEPLMQAAWAQLGDLAEINAMLRQAQLARFAGDSIYRRHFAPLPLGDLLQVTRPVHADLTATGQSAVSARASLAESSTAEAAATAQFRALTRRADPGELLAPQDTPHDFQRKYDDSWLMSMTPDAAKAMSAAAVQAAMGTPDAVPDQLVQVGAVLRDKGTFTDQMTTPLPDPAAPIANPGFQLAEWAVRRNYDYVSALVPANPAEQPDVAQALLAPLGALLKVTGDPRLAAQARSDMFSLTDALKLTPSDERLATVARQSLSAEIMVQAIAAGEIDLSDNLDQAGLAAVAKVALPDSELAAAAQQVDPHVLAVAVQEQPNFTQLTAAAVQLVAQAGLGQVTIPTGTGETGTGEVTIPTGRAGIGEVAQPEAGVAFDEEAGDFNPVQQLGSLDLGTDALQLIASGNAGDDLLAKVAVDTSIIGEAGLADIVRDHLPDDELAGLVPDILSEDDAIRLANGCFEEPEVFGDDRIAEAILALLARKRLGGDDVNGLCGVDDIQFLQDYLRVHQSLAPITLSEDQRDRIRKLFERLADMTWPGTPVRDPFIVDRSHLLAQLAPATTVTRRVGERLGQLPGWLPGTWFADGRVQPVLAPLTFDRQMYEALLDFDPDWLVPGLSADTQRDMITVLESNPQFVEGFLAGLSHEMSRELLWRGYPTDLRGTYFRRFWSSETDELSTDLRDMNDGPLGTHLDERFDQFLVLLVRGELVRRYPDLLALALRPDGMGGDGRPVFGGASEVAPIVFQRHCPPDVLLVGFELTAGQVAAAAAEGNGPSWWFVLAEHPSAVRFGLDVDAGAGSPTSADSLAWPQFPLSFGSFLDGTRGPAGIGWNQSAADVARLLVQDPFRAAFDLQRLIDPALRSGQTP